MLDSVAQVSQSLLLPLSQAWPGSADLVSPKRLRIQHCTMDRTNVVFHVVDGAQVSTRPQADMWQNVDEQLSPGCVVLTKRLVGEPRKFTKRPTIVRSGGNPVGSPARVRSSNTLSVPLFER